MCKMHWQVNFCTGFFISKVVVYSKLLPLSWAEAGLPHTFYGTDPRTTELPVLLFHYWTAVTGHPSKLSAEKLFVTAKKRKKKTHNFQEEFLNYIISYYIVTADFFRNLSTIFCLSKFLLGFCLVRC